MAPIAPGRAGARGGGRHGGHRRSPPSGAL